MGERRNSLRFRRSLERDSINRRSNLLYALDSPLRVFGTADFGYRTRTGSFVGTCDALGLATGIWNGAFVLEEVSGVFRICSSLVMACSFNGRGSILKALIVCSSGWKPAFSSDHIAFAAPLALPVLAKACIRAFQVGKFGCTPPVLVIISKTATAPRVSLWFLSPLRRIVQVWRDGG